ncbi:FtsH protease activity modulator HflK [Rivibacter subsaxonicus]|nr:FtsH protease activity modulator HflK [Rivibacter subsaxonicus]
MPDPAVALPPEPFPPMARIGALARAAAALTAGLIRRLRPGRDSLVLNSGGRNDGPPDLDELWRDFNRKLSGLFGGGGKGEGPRGGNEQSPQPDMKSAGIGLGVIGLVVLLIWAGSGFFIVQEGQQGVILSFGRYNRTVDAGIQWRAPYPFQSHEVVNFTQLRSVEIGRSATVQSTGLRDSSMLTQDENIVDIRFTVQYRLKDSRDFLFENRNPDEAVVLAAESAVREIVGRSDMNSVLYERRDELAVELSKSLQTQIDRLRSGILVTNVNVQSVQPPEAVQAAFDDAVKATADRQRFQNEGQAYANDVIPRAQGTASRLRAESEGYRERVVAQAVGDASRFKQVLAEYQKAPVVTRDRLYVDTMREVYSNVSKVMIDVRNNSNLLYLPLDKLIQATGAGTPVTVAPAAPESVPSPSAPAAAAAADARSRDNQRGRDREGR